MRRLLLTLLTFIVVASAEAADVKKMFILGGELSNSAATCTDDMDNLMPRMKDIGLNTILVPAYWELIEKEEGEFDFSLIDRTINKARENDLKVVFLWFGAWKNSMSCYAPLWFKQNYKKYPRSRTLGGKPLEIASAFSEKVFQADNRAFGALMQHIADTDKQTGTVIMMQIENEIGMLTDARDHSNLANKEYEKGVPAELMNYLKHAQLHPWMKDRFTGKGKSWAEVFGNDVYSDEIFMAYHYAKYVERLAKTARSIYNDMPLYVNTALNSRGRKPGEYPSAGPLAHLIDVWHCGAPSIDMLSPDIYDTGFKNWSSQYALWNNPLFIPEARCCNNSGARALYAFGEHRALGFSPFAIDQASPRDIMPITKSYKMLNEIKPLLNGNKTYGLLFDQEDKERTIADGNTVMICRHYFTLPWDSRATDGSTWDEGGAIIIKLADNDYVVAGTGVVITFATGITGNKHDDENKLGEDGFALKQGDKAVITNKKFNGKLKGIGSVDEVNVDKTGKMTYLRRLNGDQDHQGRHVRIAVGDYKILHVRLYDYE